MQPSSDEDAEFDENGHYRKLVDLPIEAGGDCDPAFQFVRDDSEVEGDEIDCDFDAVKRRRLNGGGFA